MPVTTGTFRAAIEATGFKYNIIPTGITDKNLPPPGNEKTAGQIRLCRRKKTTTTTKWLALFARTRRKFAHPLAVLARRCEVTRQRYATIFTIWTDQEDRLWCLIMNDGPEESRHHDVRIYQIQNPAEDKWWPYCEAAYENCG